MAKIKLKTNKSAAKRLKVTGSGKVMRRKGWKGHLLTGKNKTRKRRLSGSLEVNKDNLDERQADAALRVSKDHRTVGRRACGEHQGKGILISRDFIPCEQGSI